MKNPPHGWVLETGDWHADEQFLEIPELPISYWEHKHMEAGLSNMGKDLLEKLEYASKWMPKVVFRHTPRRLTLYFSIERDTLLYSSNHDWIVEYAMDFVAGELRKELR